MKNTLVQYQGGGYDGCFWEWNFAYLDADGKFHNLFSSGHRGCETREHLRSVIAQPEGTYLYPLDEEDSIAEFNREANPLHVLGVARELENLDIEFPVYCDKCGRAEADGLEYVQLVNWHGCGGIMSQPERKLCWSCWSLGSCNACGEYYGESEIKHYERLDTELCEGCAREELDSCFDCGESELDTSLIDGFCTDCRATLPANVAWRTREHQGKTVQVLVAT